MKLINKTSIYNYEIEESFHFYQVEFSLLEKIKMLFQKRYMIVINNKLNKK